MLSPAAKALLELLERGRPRAIRRSKLAAWLTAAGHRVTDRGISELTEELIEAGYPVASTRRAPGGVYLCANGQERAEYASMLRDTIIALARRMRQFDAASYETLLAQPVMGFMRGEGQTEEKEREEKGLGSRV